MSAVMMIRRFIILTLYLITATCPFVKGFDDDGPSLLVTENNRLLHLTVSGTGVEETVIPTESDWICGITYDPVEDHVYWRDWLHGSIWRTDLTDGNVEKILPDSQVDLYYYTCGLSLDKRERKLFYDGPDYSQISVLDLETKQSEILLELPDGGNALDIRLDEERRLIYWRTDDHNIQSADYKGENYKQLIHDPEWVSAFSLDKEGGVLYWCSHWDKIRSMTTDGKEREEVAMNNHNGYCDDIVFVDQTLVFVEGGNTIYYVPSVGGSATPFISKSGYNFYRLQVNSKGPFYEEPPEITIDLTPSNGTPKSKLTFYCNFKEHYVDVAYRTIWTVDGQVIVQTEPETWSSGKVIYIQALTENDLMNAGITTLGFQVQCSVEADRNGSLSTSLNSNSKFIGIQLSETSLSMAMGEFADISLQLTVPFGCGAQSEPCQLHIEAFTTEVLNECEATVQIPEGGVVIDSTHWSSPVNLTLSSKISPTYGTLSRLVTLKLVTSSLEHQIWADYELGVVTVELTKDTSRIQHKKCHSANDPHMKTFDGRLYEHQFKGNFTLYKHQKLPIEVQMQTVSCGYGPNIWCNCGVAVRAGRTVFEINRCPGQSRIWFISYTLCEDGQDILQVKQKGSEYIISLPSGGKVKVNVYGTLLNVALWPSVQDVEQSAGLCGRLSRDDVCSDDFTLRDGSYTTDSSALFPCYRGRRDSLPLFSNSWRVLEGSNLFDHKDHGSLDGWPYSKKFCSCPHIERRGQVGQDTRTTSCSTDFTLNTCKYRMHAGFRPVICEDKHRIGRRSIGPFSSLKRQKRQVNSLQGNWTEDSARVECKKIFQASGSVQVCGDIEGVDTNSSIEDCVLDIKLTGTTDFSPYSVDTVRSECLNEVDLNPVLQEKSSQSNESIYDLVTAHACPHDCTGHGNCNEGFCQCDDDFGGEDCSVDLTEAPFILDIHDNGHCDISKESCNLISVYGETFTEGNTTCLVEHLKVIDGHIKKDYSKSVMAQVESISHVRCTMTLNTGDTGNDVNDFVRAYSISVSNDGVHFSNNASVLVFDGRCIAASINGTLLHWEKEESYCLHNGRCYMGGSSRIDNECIVCDSNATSNAWRNSTEPPCTHESLTTLTSKLKTERTIEPITAPTTYSTTEATITPTTAPTSVLDTEPTAQPTTRQTTRLTTQPITDPTDELSTASTTYPTTEPTTVPTPDPITEPTTYLTTKPTTPLTIDPTTGTTTDVITETTTAPTTDSTNEPTPDPITEPTTYLTTKPTTPPTIDPTTGATTDVITETTPAPTTDSTNEPNTDTTEHTTGPTTDQTFTPTNPTIEPTPVSNTEPTAKPTNESAWELPTTELTTEQTTKSTAASSTEPSNEPSTYSSAAPTIKPTPVSTVESSTSELITQSTSETTMASIYNATTKPTTELNETSTNEPTDQLATEHTIWLTPRLTTEPTSEKNTEQTTEPTTMPVTELSTEQTKTTTIEPATTSTSKPTTESISETSTETSTDGTQISTTREYNEPSDKLGLNDDITSAIAIFGGIVGFFLLVTVIAIVTLKLGKWKRSRATEATRAKEFLSFLDAEYRGIDPKLASRTDATITMSSQHSVTENDEMQSYWDIMKANRGSSITPRFIPRVYLKDSQMNY